LIFCLILRGSFSYSFVLLKAFRVVTLTFPSFVNGSRPVALFMRALFFFSQARREPGRLIAR